MAYSFRKAYSLAQGNTEGTQARARVAYDEHLAERVRTLLASRTDVGERKMFGGLTFFEVDVTSATGRRA